jgi:hypothetical protein
VELACPVSVAPVPAFPKAYTTLPFKKKAPVAEYDSSKTLEYTFPTREPSESTVAVHVPESPPSKVPDHSPSNWELLSEESSLLQAKINIAESKSNFFIMVNS